MAYIIAQKIIRNENGIIVCGSASIVESVYLGDKSKKYHSRHSVRERLGKVLWLSDDRKSGIFMSPTRGLIGYDSINDEFQEIEAGDIRLKGLDVASEPPVHTVFGDVYLLLRYLISIGVCDIIGQVFPDSQSRERLLCHILHGVLKDGSRISCGDFIGKSAAARLFSVPMKSLDSDTAFFSMMGDDAVRLAFFKAFVSDMRKRHPDFGKCTYVDSTPLPNDIENNPMNFLCSHGVGSVAVQSRLIFILDKQTGLPVWFHIIPGNILDFSTVKTVLADVEACLDITIEEMVLDAGYVSRDLMSLQSEGLFKHLIARMPAKNGFPFKQLYNETKGKFKKGRYTFVRNGHVYFGERKNVTIFDCKTNAYVYVDWLNADSRRASWEESHPEEVKKMKPSEKDWLAVQFGYFVLLSDKEMEPEALLEEYFERTDIESVNKTAKDYGELLPLRKWNYRTVVGKILYDIINTIVILRMRKSVREYQPDKKQVKSLTHIIGKAQSLMCRYDNGCLMVETANKQTKEAYNLLKIKVPSAVKVNTLKEEIFGKPKM